MRAAGTDIDTDPEQMFIGRRGESLYRWSFSYWLDGDEYHVEFLATDAEHARRHARALSHNRVLRGKVVSQGTVKTPLSSADIKYMHSKPLLEMLRAMDTAVNPNPDGSYNINGERVRPHDAAPIDGTIVDSSYPAIARWLHLHSR